MMELLLAIKKEACVMPSVSHSLWALSYLSCFSGFLATIKKKITRTKGISVLLTTLGGSGKADFFFCPSSDGESFAQRFCRFSWYSANWFFMASLYFSLNLFNCLPCSNPLANFTTSRWNFWQIIRDSSVESCTQPREQMTMFVKNPCYYNQKRWF